METRLHLSVAENAYHFKFWVATFCTYKMYNTKLHNDYSYLVGLQHLPPLHGQSLQERLCSEGADQIPTQMVWPSLWHEYLVGLEGKESL